MSRKPLLDRLLPHRDRLAARPMREMFDSEGDRFDRYSLSLDGLLLDFSKNRIDEEAMAALVELAVACEVEERREAMFAGVAINTTERRAVLHTALRNSSSHPVMADGEDVMPAIRTVLGDMRRFANAVRDGSYRITGGQVRDVVNIGIGGSDLGPAMAVRALSAFADGPRVHFVSNVDGADFADTARGLDPATTLFIVASKTFTTAETMANARTARDWLVKAVGSEHVGRHFADRKSVV